VTNYLRLRAEGCARHDAAKRSGIERNATTLIGIERNALTYAGVTVWNRHYVKKERNGHERYRPRGEWVLQRGTHEAFIPEEQAEKIMAAALPRLERLTRRPGAATLLGGLVFTPEGKSLTGSGDGYYRAGKGRRIPVAALEAVVRDQMNEDVDSHEFTRRFVAELRREADKLPSEPAKLQAERRGVAKKIAALLKLAEKAPDSAALAARLRQLEDEERGLDEKIASAAQASGLRKALYATTEAQAKEILAAWMERDGTTLDEERAGIARMVEWIEFDPATGQGQITYRIPAGSGAGRFHIRDAAELGVVGSKPGCPLGQIGYRSFRVHR